MAEKIISIKVVTDAETRELGQLQKQLVATRTRMSELNKVQRDFEKGAKNARQLTVQETKELGKLKTEATAVQNRIVDLNNTILKNNDALKKNSGFVAGVRKGIGQFATSMVGVVAIVGTLTAAFKQGFETIKKYDESIANLRKVTGLSSKEARKLGQELLKIDTRTSTDNILELATAAGRLGLRGRDIIDFTKQADRAFVALGDSLEGTAEEIGLSLGKIASNFGVEQTLGIGEAINKVGSSLNELGANSKAQEGAILDFTNRLSGVASQAGLTIPEVQSLGALFNESGQSIEVAATTFNKLLPEMGKNVGRFAKIAGVDLDEFSKLVRDKPFEALKLVAKGAKSSDEGLVGLTETLKNYGINNARAAGIVGVLSGKTERLTELQNLANKAFEDGTSLSNEFAIKNETLTAKIAKLGKAWDRFILSIEDGDGVVGKSVGFTVDLFSDLLTKITNLSALSKVVLGGLFGGLKDATNETKDALLDMGSTLLQTKNQFKAYENLPIKQVVELENKTRLFVNTLRLQGLSLEDSLILWERYVQRRVEAEKATKKGKKALEEETKVIVDGDKTNVRSLATLKEALSEAEKARQKMSLADKVGIAQAQRQIDTLKVEIEAYELLGKEVKETTKLLERFNVGNMTPDEILKSLLSDGKIPEIEITVDYVADEEADEHLAALEDAVTDKKLAAIKERQDLIKQGAIDAAQILSDALFDQQRIADDNELRAIDERHRKELNALSLKEKKALAIETLTADERAKLEADLALRREIIEQRQEDAKLRLQKKQFEKSKNMAKLQALINGALAITSTLAAAPGFTDLTTFGVSRAVQVGLTAAATAAQVAAINAQQFAKGGMVQNLSSGRINGASNIPTQPNGDNMLATVRTGEVILNQRQQAMLGGAPTFKAMGVPGFAHGGVAIPSFSRNQTQSQNNIIGNSINDIASLIDSRISSIPVIVSENDISGTQRGVSIDENLSSF